MVLHFFMNHTDSQANVTAAIVIPLVLVLFVLILLVIIMPVVVKYTQSITVCVTFSVEDKPGSLAKALKIFKDCNVNILGLNTHLYHADFDRNAGKGYKYNYIHCKCTKRDKEFLKKELRAEFEEGNYQLIPTSQVIIIIAAFIQTIKSTKLVLVKMKRSLLQP